MTELISRRLRSMLMDYLAANSVLREIESEFEAEEIPYAEPQKNVGGQRRTLIQGYYEQIDFTNPADARRFLNVLAVFMGKIERTIRDPTPWGNDVSRDSRRVLEEFEEQLRRDGYAFDGGVIVPITAAARLADAKSIATGFDAKHIHDQIQRIEASIDTDPALAIGTAKELVESCFKTILAERGVEAGKGDDLPQLGKKVLKELKLLPDDVPETAKGADTIRRMLSNMATIVQGLGELRSLYGTGHGKEGRAKGLSPRHARLAVGSASTLVTFIFQTHLETSA
jgi:hypothetical protein